MKQASSKLVHLRLSREMTIEIKQACKEFHYQSPADFLRESAREKLRSLEKHKVLKKLKARELDGKKINEIMNEIEEEEKHELRYFS